MVCKIFLLCCLSCYLGAAQAQSISQQPVYRKSLRNPAFTKLAQRVSLSKEYKDMHELLTPRATAQSSFSKPANDQAVRVKKYAALLKKLCSKYPELGAMTDANRALVMQQAGQLYRERMAKVY